jgi:hypothetical protein
LDLSQNNLGDKGVAKLAELLTLPPPQVTAGTPALDGPQQASADAASSNAPCLQVLVLDRCRITHGIAKLLLKSTDTSTGDALGGSTARFVGAADSTMTAHYVPFKPAQDPQHDGLPSAAPPSSSPSQTPRRRTMQLPSAALFASPPPGALASSVAVAVRPPLQHPAPSSSLTGSPPTAASPTGTSTSPCSSPVDSLGGSPRSSGGGSHPCSVLSTGSSRPSLSLSLQYPEAIEPDPELDDTLTAATAGAAAFTGATPPRERGGGSAGTLPGPSSVDGLRAATGGLGRLGEVVELQWQQKLVLLSLSHNPLGALGSLYLGSFLRASVGLQSLALSCTSLSTQPITEALATNKNLWERLRQLDLSGNVLVNEAAPQLEAFLRNSHRLRLLRLRRVGLRRLGWECILRGCCSNAHQNQPRPQQSHPARPNAHSSTDYFRPHVDLSLNKLKPSRLAAAVAEIRNMGASRPAQGGGLGGQQGGMGGLDGVLEKIAGSGDVYTEGEEVLVAPGGGEDGQAGGLTAVVIRVIEPEGEGAYTYDLICEEDGASLSAVHTDRLSRPIATQEADAGSADTAANEASTADTNGAIPVDTNGAIPVWDPRHGNTTPRAPPRSTVAGGIFNIGSAVAALPFRHLRLDGVELGGDGLASLVEALCDRSSASRSGGDPAADADVGIVALSLQRNKVLHQRLSSIRPVNRRKRQRLSNALSSLLGGAIPSLQVLQLAGGFGRQGQGAGGRRGRGRNEATAGGGGGGSSSGRGREESGGSSPANDRTPTRRPSRHAQACSYTTGGMGGMGGGRYGLKEPLTEALVSLGANHCLLALDVSFNWAGDISALAFLYAVQLTPFLSFRRLPRPRTSSSTRDKPHAARIAHRREQNWAASDGRPLLSDAASAWSIARP